MVQILRVGASLLATLLLTACGSSPAPDLIFRGGPILTVNDRDDVVEALAVKDGLIVAVGPEARVMALRGESTEVVDLQGQTLLPGFVAAHEHPSVSAVFNGTVDLSGFRHATNAAVWQTLREAVAKAPAGEWIYAGGLDPMLTPDLRIPNRRELDAIAPRNPVVLVSQTLHSFWANSQAFSEAGITSSTPDPGAGAYYERDAQGELTGFVAEPRAAAPLIKRLRSPWQVYGRYVDELDRLRAAGFTSVASLGYNVPPWLARLAASRRFHPRIRQYFYLGEDELKYLPDSPLNGDAHFRVLGVKLWHDGSPYTGSMFTSTPYLDTPLAHTLGIQPGTHGAPMIPESELVAKLRHYTRAGWQVAIHSQGDASNRAVLAAIGKAAPLAGRAPAVRLEHGVFLPEQGLQQLAQLGVTTSFHIHHIRYYGDALSQDIVGPAAAAHVLPVRAAFAAGLRPTLHADSPMFPPRGFALMQTAIDRRTSGGQKLDAAQAITAQQALRAMTINAAWQLRIHEYAGSLEVGKWADLQVVDRNPYTTPVAELGEIRVSAVYLDGRP